MREISQDHADSSPADGSREVKGTQVKGKKRDLLIGIDALLDE
jgi:hypothetical protein